MYFINTKHVDNLQSLTASEEVVTFEASNLQLPLPSSRWRSTTVLPNIVGQFDESRTVDYWGLWYSNAIRTDFARLRLATSQANLTTAPVIDHTTYIWPGAGIGFHGAITLGATGKVDFGDVLNQGAGDDFSIELRFNTATSSSSRGLANKKASSAAGTAGWNININGADNLVARVSDGVDQVTVSVDVSSLLDGTWQRIRLEVDRTAQVMRLYLNGILSATSATISAVGALTNAVALQLGTTSTDNGYWQDSLDEFRLWSAVSITASGTSELDVVTPPANLELYWRANTGELTVAVDESGNGNDGTITGGTWINVDPPTFPDLSTLPHVHQRSIITTPAAATWFQIDHNFTGNPDGFVQASNLFLDARITPAIGVSQGWTVNLESRAQYKVPLAGGGTLAGGGSHRQGASFTFEALTEVEMGGELEPLLRDRLMVKPVGAVFDEDETTYPMLYMYYGYLTVDEVPVQWDKLFVMNARIEEP